MFLNIRFEKDGNNNAKILLSVKLGNVMSTVLREFCFENLTYGLLRKEHKLIIDGLRNEIHFYHGSRMPTFWYCFEFENRVYPTLC